MRGGPVCAYRASTPSLADRQMPYRFFCIYRVCNRAQTIICYKWKEQKKICPLSPQSNRVICLRIPLLAALPYNQEISGWTSLMVFFPSFMYLNRFEMNEDREINRFG